MSLNLRFLSNGVWTESLLLFASALLLLIFLAYNLRNDSLIHSDQIILSWFHSIKSLQLNHFFSAITWMGSLWILLPLYLLLTITVTPYIEHFEKALGITLWGTVLSTYLLKYEFERKRPHLFGAINELPIDPSFPSAHTAQITAFTLGIWISFHGVQILHKEVLGSFFLFIVLAVAASRMYLQVHFPSDIAAGVLIALIWAIIASWVIKSGVLG